MHQRKQTLPPETHAYVFISGGGVSGGVEREGERWVAEWQMSITKCDGEFENSDNELSRTQIL